MLPRGRQRTLLDHYWLLVVTVGIAATIAYVLLENDLAKAIIVTAVSSLATAAVLVGVRLHRPTHRAPWIAIAFAQLVYTVGWIFWEAEIIDTGFPPASDSLVNLLFMGSYVALFVGICMMLGRREGDFIGIVDAAILTAAGLTVAWELLLHHILENQTVSVFGQQVLVGYVVMDVALFAVLARLAASTGSRRPALMLLVASLGGVLFSDAIWNWSLQFSTYTVGSWGDAGWILFSVFAGAAALHPSMHDVSVRRDIGRRLRWDQLSLFVAAALSVPAVLVAQELGGHELHKGASLALGAALVTVLVITRLTLIVREETKLASRLSAQNEQLVELDRLKDNFVASVSHELRTPLTSIRGFLDLVLAGHEGDLSGGQRECLDIVHRNADRLQYLVGDLLFVAQVDAGKLALDVQDVELTAVAAESCRSAKPRAAEKDIALSFSGVERSTVSGDPVRLAQLVDNLISNALKFTPKGGRADVRVAAEDRWLRLEIADSGIGIPEAEQELLFDRFFRASAASENAIQGTGLGLSISKAIIDAHGGRIEVESAEGVGTTFRVRLPVAAAQPERAVAETEAAA